MGEAITPQMAERQTVAEEAQALPEEFTFISAGDDPLAAAAALKEAGLGDDGVTEEYPVIEVPAPSSDTIPGGLVYEGQVYRKAIVRELNGQDEELLARALAAGDFIRYQQVTLECGVEEVGPVKATPEVLNSLLVGDRDALIFAIRIATFGKTVELDVTCQHCGVESKISVDLADEIPMLPLKFPAEQPHQEVVFRNGSGSALVRLATGADQHYVSGLENVTQAEVNTELMTRCVKSIDGVPVNGKADVLRLGMGPRNDIINWMTDNQPGPDYDAVKHTCTICGKETPLGLTTGDLFRG